MMSKKYTSFFFVLAFLALGAISAARAEGLYSSVIEDLPLMDGMAEFIDNAVIFDKPGGRIVETSASFTNAEDAVYAFYVASLPPLGWMMRDKNTFVRENEILSVDIDGQTVHFKISPAPQGPVKP